MLEILISSLIAVFIITFIYILISFLMEEEEKVILIDENKNIYLLYLNPALYDIEDFLNDISYKYNINFIKIDKIIT